MIFLFLDENDIIKYNIKLIFIIFDRNNKGAMIYACFDIHSTFIWRQFSSSTLLLFFSKQAHLTGKVSKV
jgi:hypothetical protein